jgi:hypothetical protein
MTMAIDCSSTALCVASPSAALHNLTAVTMTAWINLDAEPVLSGVLSIDSPNQGSRKALYLNDEGSHVVGMGVIYSVGDAYATAPCPSLNQWHHICGRWDAAVNQGRGDVLIDGVDATAGRTTPAGSPAGDGGKISVGTVSVLGLLFAMDGLLAEVAIFDRRLDDAEVRAIASGRLRAGPFDPIWHLTLEGSLGVAAVGDIGLRDLSGRANHVDLIVGAPAYTRDPPLHWPVGPEAVPYAGRTTRNSRGTMNVAAGTRLRTMRKGSGLGSGV